MLASVLGNFTVETVNLRLKAALQIHQHRRTMLAASFQILDTELPEILVELDSLRLGNSN